MSRPRPHRSADNAVLQVIKAHLAAHDAEAVTIRRGAIGQALPEMPSGTVRRALNRLAEDGWIARTEGEMLPDGRRSATTYALGRQRR